MTTANGAVLNLVSVGPGHASQISGAALDAIDKSDVVIGYELYLEFIKPHLESKLVITRPLTQEKERAIIALDYVRQGKKVALLSGGDIGVYGMAPLLFDLMGSDDRFELNVLPGITSANACSSLLGAPLAHDFATLSLSDLLCPWDVIESRASLLAEADIAVALYNVQSKTRIQGVYKIIDIFLKHRRQETVCGVVRDAFRPEQQVYVTTLGELSGQTFDMRTTIIIGNQHTRRKGDWMYTPRGYLGWGLPADGVDSAAKLPERALWVFSGTKDGNAIAEELIMHDYAVVVSSATDYGKQLAGKACIKAATISGKLGRQKRQDLLQRKQARAIVDATHPFATVISTQLMEIANELEIPYIRFERPSSLPENAIVCRSMEEAAAKAITLGKKIFLATGSKNLDVFLNQSKSNPKSNDVEWFVRLAPHEDSLKRTLALGVPSSNICAMQGPFSRAVNEALWRDWQIECVVTKESGTSGGLMEKALAAQALNIPLVIVERPKLSYPLVVADSKSLLSEMNRLNFAKHDPNKGDK